MFGRRFSFVIFFFTFVGSVQSQTISGKNEVGINVGALFYQGDLTPNLIGSYKTAKPVGEIYYNRIITPYWAARLNLAVGALAGDDRKYDDPPFMKRRKFNFTSPLFEFSALAVFNVFGNNDNTSVLKFSPYVFAGAGAAFLNIQRDWSGIDSLLIHAGSSTLAGLRRDSATAPPRVLPVFPIGIGFKYAVSPRIALVSEVKYRFTFSDYLDGFSFAANPEKKDNYYGLTIGAVYNFGGESFGGSSLFRKNKSRTDCPKF